MESVQDLPMAAELGAAPAAPAISAREGTTFAVILALSFSHMLNDTIQSLIPALYPMLKVSFGLNFAEIGLITLAFNLTASILQPAVGAYTDKHPQTYALAAGMGSTLIGLLLLSVASSYPMLLLAAALVGTGSSVFHPEILPGGASGLGRAARHGAVAVPGRRQYWIVAGAAAGRLHRAAAAARPASPGSR